MEREKSQKKPKQGCSGYQLGTTALNYKDNYKGFRIRCIMLILGNIHNETCALYLLIIKVKIYYLLVDLNL